MFEFVINVNVVGHSLYRVLLRRALSCRPDCGRYGLATRYIAIASHLPSHRGSDR